MSAYIFDIETCPLPPEELAVLEPKLAPAKNLKDPEKIAADIAAKRAAWLEDAALSAITGRVLAVGVLRGEEPEIFHGYDEHANIGAFWDLIHEGGSFAGFNVASFDLPFLVRRSWKLGIPIPPIRSGRHWSGNFIDLRDVWGLGEYHPEGSLDMISRHLGFPGKDSNGKLFHQLYIDDVGAALKYLANDLYMTQRLERALKV